MTKFKIIPNMVTYRTPRVYSVSDPKKDGVLIRWLDFSHAMGFVVWDDTRVRDYLEMTNGEATCIEVELCELDGS